MLGPTGGYSEVRLIEADRLVRLPDAISFDQAAEMKMQGMTAQVLIRQIYTVKEGDLIRVHAAACGIGLILCHACQRRLHDQADRHSSRGFVHSMQLDEHLAACAGANACPRNVFP
jgi:D-arabinose 1-dehydrogenase-like Zn-dependent alcohol dehydrogenase